MPTDHLMEGEDAVEKDLESVHQKIVAKQSSKESAGSATSIESELHLPVKLTNQRSSNRLTKRARKDQPSEVVLKKPVTVKQEVPSKTRRPWELWSVEDKNAFFEALCEYGKDFENIQSYIAQRSKKKGVAVNMIKNKDQVRHFYYRTWHKISKFLDISECVQKQTQELYGLINYGELRKKIGGCLNEKNRVKLNELVFSGVTTVKYKGKKLRIKTPVCRALKKLNNFSDAKEPESERLPKEIYVELRPHTNAAWLHVQDLAQNPRVRTKVCLQKRLKSVIEYMQRRWKSYRLKRKEQILNSLPNYNAEELTCDIPPILRVKPPRDMKIYPLSFSIIDTASSSDVCLEKYMKLSEKSLCKDVSKSKKVVNSKTRSLGDKLIESSQAVLEKTNNIVMNNNEQSHFLTDMQDLCHRVNKITEDNSYINILTPPKSVPELDHSTEFSSLPSLINPLTCPSDNFNIFSSDIEYNPLLSANDINSNLFNITEQSNQMNSDISTPNITENNLESVLIINNCANSNAKKDDSSEKVEKDKHLVEKSEKNKNVSDDNEDIYCKTVRQGWTVDEAGYLTFGELFLMLGKPPTIVLEYEFEYPENTANNNGTTSATTNPTSSELSQILNKVFEVAQTFLDPKQKQILGKQHTRGSSSKSAKPKSSGLNEKASKDTISSHTSPILEPVLNSKVKNDIVMSCSASISSPVSSTPSSTSTTIMATPIKAKTSSDKHVFIMPIGTAPRTMKHPNQNSLKEELGKLLPCTRRGCRIRRKPLVVPRPLLPREGMRPMTGPRPMTVVQLVPSVSPITTVIPPCSRPKNNIPAPKKVVNILPSGMPVDIHPIQVPVIKQIHPDSGQNMILQNSVSSPHLIVNSTSSDPLRFLNNPMTAVNSVNESTFNSQSAPSQDLPSASHLELNASSDLNNLNFTVLPGHTAKNVNESKETFPSLSLSDTSNFVSSASPTFLDEFGLTSKNSIYDSSNLSSCLNLDVGSSKDYPSENSSQQPFRINSSDIQWLNGESTELSLNTFLNSIESSPMMTSSATSNIASENSNLDPIVRLAPVVDSQVRCLLDECSIDFITKFEDLADVINNSSSSDYKPT